MNLLEYILWSYKKVLNDNLRKRGGYIEFIKVYGKKGKFPTPFKTARKIFQHWKLTFREFQGFIRLCYGVRNSTENPKTGQCWNLRIFMNL